jgi:hypothetical protein
LVFAICRSPFPSLAAPRLFPSAGGRKQVWLALVILAVGGCGGEDNASSVQTVSGAGYRFEAPGDWIVERSGRTLSVATEDQASVISVTSFRLAREYRPELWPQAAAELDQVAAKLARALGGTVEDRATVRIAARRGRAYRFAGTRDKTRRIGFVLAGRREFQLLCRGDGEVAPCDRLFATFTLVPAAR